MHLVLLCAALLLVVPVHKAESGRCRLNKLKNLAHVSIESEPFTLSGDRLNVTCDHGFSAVENMPLCRSKTWYPDNGTLCRESRCQLQDLKNLNHVSQASPSFTLPGRRVNITCDYGYSAEKNLPMCRNGAWVSNREPLCKESDCEIPEIRFGLIGYERFGDWFWNGWQYARNLTYITIPSGSRVSSGRELWFLCDKPHSVHERGAWRKEVKCSKGRWSTDFQCLRAGEKYVPSTTTEIPKEECFCEYLVEDARIIAHADGKRLIFGDKVRKGSSVIFRCQHEGYDRFSGQREIACSDCKPWHSSEMLSCTSPNRDIPCPRFLDSPELIVSYSKDVSVSSIATFRCSSSARNLVGQSVSICQENGTWSNPLPSCEATDIRCPPINGGEVFRAYYDMERRINSTAIFICRDNGKRIDGCSSVTCLPNGEWTPCNPTCVGDVSCPKFPSFPGLDVTYSKNMSVGSVAKFSCLPSTRNLVGNPVSTCQENGSWSSHLPSCEDTKCSIRDLLKSISEDVELNITDITGDLKANSVVGLKCRDHSVINGNANVVCGEDGKWKLGNYECALGCVLNIDSTSHLLAHPVKDSYSFGEFVILKCARGYLMTDNVERMMCLGSTWSDSLPGCKPWRQLGDRD